MELPNLGSPEEVRLFLKEILCNTSLCSDFIDVLFRYLNGPTSDTYATIAKNNGQQPETVTLPHDAEGFWLGNKNAKKVLVYYHGSCLQLSVSPGTIPQKTDSH